MLRVQIAVGWVRKLDRHSAGIQMIDAVEQAIERMLQVLFLIRRPMRLIVVVGIGRGAVVKVGGGDEEAVSLCRGEGESVCTLGWLQW